MIYTFITEKDLDVAMKEYFREQITVDQERIHIQTTSEAAAFSLIKAKINARYDVLKLFPVIKQWSGTTAYLADEYAWKNHKIYKAKQAGTNQDPETQTAYWEVSDPRDQLLVVYCAIITVYFMMESVNPRKISDSLHNRYAGIMEWLDEVKEGTESPDWPLKEGGINDVQWGSNEQLDHYY